MATKGFQPISARVVSCLFCSAACISCLFCSAACEMTEKEIDRSGERCFVRCIYEQVMAQLILRNL